MKTLIALASISLSIVFAIALAKSEEVTLPEYPASSVNLSQVLQDSP